MQSVQPGVHLLDCITVKVVRYQHSEDTIEFISAYKALQRNLHGDALARM